MIKKIIYVLIVIGAFYLGHHFGEDAAKAIDSVPLPKVTIEMPGDELDKKLFKRKKVNNLKIKTRLSAGFFYDI